MDWAPQQDLLGDARVTAFVTHGGLNSVYEVRFPSGPGALPVSALALFFAHCFMSPAIASVQPGDVLDSSFRRLNACYTERCSSALQAAQAFQHSP